MKKVYLYNTMSRSKEEFVPLQAGKVGIYTCGPTVYNYAHIGNLRTYIFEDVLKKTLELAGYKVKHVMNITDVGHLTDDADSGEDKIEKAARKERKTIKEIVDYYTDCFLKDIDALNIKRPAVMCKASEHIPEMLALIKRLEDNGHTYSENGNVYFSIDTFPDYGKLANLQNVDLKAGERVNIDASKRNPYDFVLWFTKSKFENQSMKWDSPYGTGYPGWHLECSAMSMKYLGEQFDIHCGGVDAIPVHHTNEIAQSEGATGRKWVNYWLHGEFLLSEKGKMSKSTGEFTTLTTLEDKGLSPLAYRYFCLQAHYRKQLQFSWDAIKAADVSLKSIYEKIDGFKKESTGQSVDKSKVSAYIDAFSDSLCNDLGTASAVSVFHKALSDKELNAAEKLEFAKVADSVLSLSLLAERSASAETEIPEEVRVLAEERCKAKADRNYALCDELRNKIAALGYEIKDGKDGYQLKAR